MALGTGASVVVESGLSSCSFWALERRHGSRSTWSSLLGGMQDRPGPGIDPASPILTGGFFITESPGKPSGIF